MSITFEKSPGGGEKGQENKGWRVKNILYNFDNVYQLPHIDCCYIEGL